MVATWLRDAVTTARSAQWTELAQKGVQNPREIPNFVLGVALPTSRWGPNWRSEDGFITFEDGGFAGGSPTRPELSARLYSESQQLESMLGDRSYDRALEVGCGYGRLTRWISEHADQTVGIDPNPAALEKARELYPQLEFVETLGQDLPFEDDSFDLIVSWGVLQHVPPDLVDDVGTELRRVLTDDGRIQCCEMTSGDDGQASWVRTRSEYEALFAPLTMVAAEGRPAERTFEYAQYADTMVFERRPAAADATAEVSDPRPEVAAADPSGISGAE